MQRFIKKPHMVASLRRGPLALFLDDIAQELIDDGYSISTGRFRILVASDFSCWMERESRDKNTLNAVRAFLRFARYQEYVNCSNPTRIVNSKQASY